MTIKPRLCGAHWKLKQFFTIIAMLYPSAIIAAPCPVSAPPNVTVEIRRDPVQEIVDTSRDELDQFAIAAGREDHVPAFGSYSSVLAYNANIDTRVVELGSDVFCASPKTVRILVMLTSRVIHLARETQASSCLLETSREHELAHAHAEERAIDDRATMFLERARLAITELRMGPTRSAAAARLQLADEVSKQIGTQFLNLEQYQHQFDQAVDSPSNLKTLQSACRSHKSQAFRSN
jgi:hypothetical protein